MYTHTCSVETRVPAAGTIRYDISMNRTRGVTSALVVAIVGVLCAASIARAQSSDCEVSDEAETQYNVQLVELHRDAEAVAEINERQLPYGVSTVPEGARRAVVPVNPFSAGWPSNTFLH